MRSSCRTHPSSETLSTTGSAFSPSDVASPLDQHRRPADARIAPRNAERGGMRISSSTCFQGHRDADGGHRAAIDSIGGQLMRSRRRNTPATTSRSSTNICRWPSTSSPTSSVTSIGAEDIEREKKVVLEEIKMVEDTPDDLVHEPSRRASGRIIRRPRFSQRRNAGVVQRRSAALPATPTLRAT